MSNPDIILYDNNKLPDLQEIKIEKAATGFQFAEGPVWHPGTYLLFSDTPANNIWQLFPNGRASVFMEKSGLTSGDKGDLSNMIGSNGLAVDKIGNVLICQHGNHAIASVDPKGTMTILANQFEGRPFNSPNDLVIHSTGVIFFSDPPYGLKDQIPHPEKYQTGGGLYKCVNGTVSLLTNELRYPNGLAFSPGEKFLYLSSNHPDEPSLWRFDLSPAGEMTGQSVLIEQNADGMTVDSKGNLFLCTDDGLLIVSPKGSRMALIPLPEMPSNVTWGGNNRSELYITARTSVYRILGITF